jgi:hypothetical protein
MKLDRVGRRLMIASGIAAVLVVSGCAGQSTTPQRYGLELTVAPTEDDATAFETKVVVRALDTGAVVFEPRMLSRAGQPATVEAKDRSSGLSYTISVEVGKDGAGATYSAEIRDHAGAVARQHGQIQFQPS